MTSTSRRFIPAALIAALLLQLLPLPHLTFAQPAAELQLQQPQAAGEAAVKITGIFVRDALPGGAVPRDISLPDKLPEGTGILRRVEVNWSMALPKGVTLEGFDVEVKATLTKGGPLFEKRSFGANARRADINVQLPSGSAAKNNAGAGNTGTGNNGAGNAGGGNTGGAGFGNGPIDCAKCADPSKLSQTEQRACANQCQNSNNAAICKGVDCRICQLQPNSSICQTCCNQTGGGQNTGGKEENKNSTTSINLQKCLTACNSKTGLAKQKCQADCEKKNNPPPRSGKFNFLPQSFVPGNFLTNHLAPQNQKSQGDPRGLIPGNSGEPAAQISSITATVTARLSRPSQAIALREFIPPAAAVMGELSPNPNPNRTRESGGLRLLKVIDIAKVPALARECPATQDCFDIIAEARGPAVNIKVSLEVLYSNNQRKEPPPRLVSSLARPVRLAVERPRDATFVTVTPTVLGEVSEAFTRSDTDQKFFLVIGK